MAHRSKKAAAEFEARYQFFEDLNDRLMAEGHCPLPLVECVRYRTAGYDAEEAARAILSTDY